MEFQRIPVEVIEDYILANLEWNDLLRLRRVCKWTKDTTDGFLRVHPEMAPEMEINEGERSFAGFVQMGIPTTKIFINNRYGHDFYRENSEDMVTFLEDFGPYIKSLRVDQIAAIPFGKELDFLEGLKNLESLEAGQFGGYRRELGPEDMERVIREWDQLRDPRIFQDDKTQFPGGFLNRLKTLKIGNNDDGYLGNLFNYIHHYLLSGKELTSVTLPFNTAAAAELGPDFRYYEFRDQPLEVAFALLIEHLLLRRPGDQSGEEPIGQEIDFQNFHNLGKPLKPVSAKQPLLV